MSQDRRLQDALCLRDFDRGETYGRIFWPEDAERVNDMTVLYLKKNSGETAVDFLQSPVYMVSGKVRDVFAMYEEDILFKKVIFIHKERRESYSYYIPMIHKLDALADCVERYPNGAEKKVILDSGRMGRRRVFFLEKSFARRPVVSIEVVESLLRRNTVGILFEEIEVV